MNRRGKIALGTSAFLIISGLFLASIPSISQLVIQPHSVPLAKPLPATGELSTISQKSLSAALPFIANEGQLPEHVYFRAQTMPGSMDVTADALQYTFSTNTFFAERPVSEKKLDPIGVKKSDVRVSYFLGSDQAKWQRDINTYDSISVGELFPGITMTIQAKEKTVERIFTVKPKANPDNIAFTFSSNINLKTNAKGELLILPIKKDAAVSVKLTAPKAFQTIKGKKKNVAVKYKLRDARTYAIAVTGAYDKNFPLTIDPELDTVVGSTYVGGNGNFDFLTRLVLDSQNNIYVLGSTPSTDLATTPGAFSTTNPQTSSVSVAFIAKYSSTSNLLAMTYFATTSINATVNLNQGMLALDPSGNVFIGGYGQAANYPTTPGAYQTSTPNTALFKGFVMKFSSDLTQLIASTLYVGSSNIFLNSGAIDSSGNVFITGGAAGGGLPTTGTPWLGSYTGAGGTVGFIAKFSNDLSQLLAASYTGGTSNFVKFITIDSGGNPLIAGQTFYTITSTDYGGYQQIKTNVGTGYDPYIQKFNSNLSQVTALTYYGGTAGNGNPQSITELKLDSSDNVYAVGYTSSTDLSMAPTAWQPSYGGGVFDMFVAKFSPNLSSLLASTYIGGVGADSGVGVAISEYPSSTQIYVYGNTENIITTTPGAYQTTRTQTSTGAGYVAEFDGNLSHLNGASYFSDSIYFTNWQGNLPNTSYGQLYFAGYTNNPAAATSGAAQSVKGTSVDGLITIFASTPTFTSFNTSSIQVGGVTTSLRITGSGFARSSTVSFGGVSLAATINSSTEINTTLSTGLLSTAGYKPLVISNGTFTSSTYNYPVSYLIPTLNSISQTSTDVTSTPIGVTFTGTNFASTTLVVINSSTVVIPSAINSTTTLTAFIPTSTLINGATNTLAVVTPAPGGGTTTGFTYVVYNLVPTISSLSQTSAHQGDGPLTISIYGTNFVPSSSVKYGASAISTTFVSSTLLTAIITNQELGTANSDATSSITVVNGAPRGGTSGAVTFTSQVVSSGGGGGGGGGGDSLPIISNILVTPSSTGAHFSWTGADDRGTASMALAYGLSNVYGLAGTVVGNYISDLLGLSANTPYFYKITATDTGSNSVSSEGTFTTLNTGATTTPPSPTTVLISDVQVNVLTTGAIITWQTNVAADSQINYGVTAAYGQSSAHNAALALSHTVTLSSLTPNTTYHFQIVSKDSEGNEAVTPDAVLATPRDIFPPPDVTNLRTQTTSASIIVRWSNPGVTDFAGITVRRTVGSPAGSASDGTRIFTGAATSVTDTHAARDVNYYYTVFAYDTSGNYSGGVYTAAVLPAAVLPPSQPAEICGNGVDDNANGLVDCADSACSTLSSCHAPTPPPAPPAPPTPPTPPTPPPPSPEPPVNPAPVVPPEDGPVSPAAPQTYVIVEAPAIFANVSATATLFKNTGTVTRNVLQNVNALVNQSAQVLAEFKQDAMLPEVQRAVGARVVPSVVAATAASALSFISWADVVPLMRYMFLQPALLLGLRRRKRWGQVYNTLDKLPIDLATVRLIDVATNRIIQTRVTDTHGRYAFSVHPGTYRLEVTKNNFVFPSQLLAEVREDGHYNDIYHNQNITISEKDTIITLNIPLDPVGATKKPTRIAAQQVARTAQTAFALTGLIMTVASAYFIPRWYVFLFLGVHILLVYVFGRLAIPPKIKSWGVVTDSASGKPIARVVVRLFSLQFNKLVGSQITDSRGRYYFLAGDSSYFATYEHPQYTTTRIEPIDLRGKDEATINLDVAMQASGSELKILSTPLR